MATSPAYQPGQNKIVKADPTVPPRVELRSKPNEQSVALPNTLDCSVKEFILRRLKSAEDDGKFEEEERVRVIMTNVLFYRGQHELYVTKDCRIESSFDEADEDDLIIQNWYAHLVEGKAKEW